MQSSKTDYCSIACAKMNAVIEGTAWNVCTDCSSSIITPGMELLLGSNLSWHSGCQRSAQCITHTVHQSAQKIQMSGLHSLDLSGTSGSTRQEFLSREKYGLNGAQSYVIDIIQECSCSKAQSKG